MFAGRRHAEAPESSPVECHPNLAAEPAHTTSDDPARERLIDAAGPLFARDGFADATVRDIADAAGVKLAAVNYYFGGKRGLYSAVVTEGYACLLASTGAHAAPTAGPQNADRARAVRTDSIQGLAERSLGPSKPHWLFEIMMREMVEPTSTLYEMVTRFIRPQHEANRRAIATLLGCDPSDHRVPLASYVLVAQVLFFKHCSSVITRLTSVDLSTPQAHVELARHIAAFSLAGLNGLCASGFGEPVREQRSP